MSKVAIVGEKDVILCFKGVGVEVFPVHKPEETLSRLRELSLDSNYSIILITESMAKPLLLEINQLINKNSSIIIIIPTHKGSQQTSLLEIKKIIERAVGIDLISKGESHKWE